MNRGLWILGPLLVFFCCSIRGQDVPRTEWSPPGGLLFWLDATQAKREWLAKEGRVDLRGKVPLDRWTDRSRHQRHFEQKVSKDRPMLHEVGGQPMVQFDGETDHLRSSIAEGSVSAATLFVVAAPDENLGDFRGLLAAHAIGKRDYQSGLNIDLGPTPTLDFEFVNIEGNGFVGATNLYRGETPFRTLKLLRVTVDPERKLVQLAVNQKMAESRPWVPSNLSTDEWTLGARFYTNGPGEQRPRGFLKGDIAEVLVFDRVLHASEVEATENYLAIKYAKVRDFLEKRASETHRRRDDQAVPIVRVSNPPAIQMLQPGFEVQTLPVSLTNINNVLYRHDGALVTLGYNGDIHLLRDSDGDGLEDQSQPFWKNNGSLRGPIGMVVAPKGYPKGNGVFVASKGKISWIVDKDGDDRADEEQVVASGWKEISQNVDAVGLTMGSDGSLYFGLGTANYANAYLVDDRGLASYDRMSERGTVQKVSPDWATRETLCTGIRFPIAFAFHRSGDLFCTEQEGATWLANGNPFDELLHVQKGKHYGFPPRHPRYNPDVIDEPSVFNYGPQHQSTCGMFFNEPNPFGKWFGPSTWKGDAIVCGESRGKLWRTKLVRGNNGYVASTQLFAQLQQLTVDACLSPRGDLIVACHSGPPDWGTGPTGMGSLYRISMKDPNVARPVMAWAESPNELRIAFDAPLDPKAFLRLQEQATIEYGDYVRAGDRFETLVPPYAVVKRQALAPRYRLPITSVSITQDMRTVLLGTQTIRSSSPLAVTLPYGDGSSPTNAIDVDLGLNGVEVEWTSKSSSVEEGWKGWLPHLDLGVSRSLTEGSSLHEQLWSKMQKEGALRMKTRIDMSDLLRPKVQLGSTIDYEWPEERGSLRWTASVPFTVRFIRPREDRKVASNPIAPAAILERSSPMPDGRHQWELAPSWIDAERGIDIELELELQGKVPEFEVGFFTNEDATIRTLSLDRFQLGWGTKLQSGSTERPSTNVAELNGGNWGKGRRIFHSEAASCFKCHAMNDRGARIGPDLSNLIHRDYASVLRDIVQPSFSINPDYIGHIVAMHDGQVLTGVLRTDQGGLYLGDEKGTVTRLPKDDIASMKPAQISIMPKGLDSKLTAEELKDLMTFLLTEPPHMPMDVPLSAPPLRTLAEVSKVLEGSQVLPEKLRSMHIVLVSGKKDHGKGEHDYPAWQMMWAQLMAAAPEVEVSLAMDFPSDDQLARADVLVFFQKGTWNDDRARRLDPYLERGGGAVFIHWAVNGEARVSEFSERIGLASKGGSIRFRHGPLSLKIHSTDHPIVRNFEKLDLYDESYWLLTGERKNIQLLATSLEEDALQPQMWTYQRGKGRVFVSIPGHYSWTFDDPLFRILLLRGTAWVAQEPTDRFNELVPLGARMTK